MPHEHTTKDSYTLIDARLSHGSHTKKSRHVLQCERVVSPIHAMIHIETHLLTRGWNLRQSGTMSWNNMWIYIHMYIYICICIHIYIHDICISLCEYTYTCTYICICIHVYIHDICISPGTRPETCVYTYTHAHTYVYVYM